MGRWRIEEGGLREEGEVVGEDLLGTRDQLGWSGAGKRRRRREREKDRHSPHRLQPPALLSS